jgi:hypothetical protein
MDRIHGVSKMLGQISEFIFPAPEQGKKLHSHSLMMDIVLSETC